MQPQSGRLVKTPASMRNCPRMKFQLSYKT
jgi:hypothetical protein